MIPQVVFECKRIYGIPTHEDFAVCHELAFRIVPLDVSLNSEALEGCPRNQNGRYTSQAKENKI